MIQIDRGITPKPKKSGSKYPFKQLEVGESFLVDRMDYGGASCVRSQLNVHTDKKFTVRRQDDGNYRFFRIK